MFKILSVCVSIFEMLIIIILYSFQTKSWLEILCKLSASADKDLCYRGVAIIHNMIHATHSCAEKIIETNLLEILMALTRPEVDDVPQKVKDLADVALKKAEEWKLIKTNTEEPEEDSD